MASRDTSVAQSATWGCRARFPGAGRGCRPREAMRAGAQRQLRLRKLKGFNIGGVDPQVANAEPVGGAAADASADGGRGRGRLDAGAAGPAVRGWKSSMPRFLLGRSWAGAGMLFGIDDLRPSRGGGCRDSVQKAPWAGRPWAPSGSLQVVGYAAWSCAPLGLTGART